MPRAALPQCLRQPSAAGRPPTPPPQPEGEALAPTRDFNRLLLEVSAEFERLRQQNHELVRENGVLRTLSGKGPDGLLWPVTEKEKDGSTKSQFSAQCARMSAAAAAAEMPILEALEPREEFREAQKRARAPEKQDVPELELVPSSPPNPPWSNAAPSSPKSMTQQRNLEEQFRRLDLSGTGKLTFEDLVSIMHKAEQPIEYAGLINTLRVCNRLEPIDFSGEHDMQDELSRSEQLDIDFPTFLWLMDTLSPSELSQNTEYIRNVQAACLHLERCHEVCTSISTKQNADKVKKRTAFWLETIPTIVILMNTLVTGLSADYDQFETVWDGFELVFVAFYTVEFIVKVRLFGCFGYFRGKESWWNMFDFVCLLLSLADLLVKYLVEVLTPSGSNKPDLTAFLMVKIFRLARLARLVRTLRFKLFHELKVMIVGVISGLRVLTWAIVLLVVMIYLVGVAMTNLFGKEQAEFRSVLASMLTMFRCWTDGCDAYNGTPLAEKLFNDYGFPWMVFHILMTMFVTVGVFNLIMAIFIDNVVTSQLMRKHREMGERANETEQKFKRLFTGFIKNGAVPGHHRGDHAETLYDRARREFETFGKEKTMFKGWTSVNLEWERMRNKNISITREAFKAWVEDEDFQRLLDEAEIETANHLELFDVLDADAGGALSMDELTTGLMQLRGPVTKADIVAVRLKVSHLTKIIESTMPHTAERPIGHRMELQDRGNKGRGRAWATRR